MKCVPLSHALLWILLPGLCTCRSKEDDAAAASGPMESAATTDGADTIEALAERMKAATADEDWGELFACVVPEDRALLPFGLVVAWETLGQMAKGFVGLANIGNEDFEMPEFEDPLAPLIEKYGVPSLASMQLDPNSLRSLPDDEVRRKVNEAYSDVDLVGFMTGLSSLSSEKEEPNSSPPKFQGELTDLEVAGDTATAKVGDEAVEFVKFGQRWFLRMPLGDQAKESPGGGAKPDR